MAFQRKFPASSVKRCNEEALTTRIGSLSDEDLDRQQPEKRPALLRKS